MELSPLAKERLAKAGELSPQEKEKIKLNEELTAILSDFFTQKLDSEGLWIRMKAYKDEGKYSMIKETQIRLAHTLILGGSDMDFDRYCSGILSVETLKEQNKYSEVEFNLDAIKKMRKQYQEEKTKAFNSMKDSIGSQVRIAAQKMARQNRSQNAAVDIDSSIEVSVRASPQWREFIMAHEKNYGIKFDDAREKLVMLV